MDVRSSKAKTYLNFFSINQVEPSDELISVQLVFDEGVKLEYLMILLHFNMIQRWKILSLESGRRDGVLFWCWCCWHQDSLEAQNSLKHLKVRKVQKWWIYELWNIFAPFNNRQSTRKNNNYTKPQPQCSFQWYSGRVTDVFLGNYNTLEVLNQGF